MEVIIQSFNGVATILIMVAIGAAIERKGWITEDSVLLISRLVNFVCLPTYMCSTMLANFSRQQLIEMAGGIAVPMLAQLSGLVAAKLLAKVMRVSKEHDGIFTICVSLSNTIFIGLPLCVALFGDTAIPYIMLYYMATTVIFWTLGVQQIASSAGEETAMFSMATVKKIASPPLFGFITGSIMVLLGLNLPFPIFRAFRYVGSMTTPLAMLFIGIAMSKTDWSQFKLSWELVAAMLGRYLICPFIVMALLPFFQLPEMMGKVFVIMAALPAMGNISVVAKAYDGDYKYAAMLTAVSTGLAVIVVPIYMWFIN